MKIFKKTLIFIANIFFFISPKYTTKCIFLFKHQYRLNLKKPKTYCEKLNWLKLYHRDDKMVMCADKYKVREYVESRGLGHLLNELYWHGSDPNLIPFSDLPNQFIIKSNKGSGDNFICYDKSSIDEKKIIKMCKKWLAKKHPILYGEWHYNKIKPLIIIEKLLQDDNGNIPKDFKLFCFNGLKSNVGFLAIDYDRYDNHTRDIYDHDWRLLKGVRMDFKNSNYFMDKPKEFEKLKEYAKVLSEGFIHSRIDFYLINGNIIFGEITFFNGAGFDKVSKSLDVVAGSWLHLQSHDNIIK